MGSPKQASVSSRPVIREMEQADIEQLVEVHLTAATDPSAGLRAYYQDKLSLYLSHPHSTVFVAEIDGQVGGLLAVTRDNASFVAHCRRPARVLRTGLRMLTGKYGLSWKRLAHFAKGGIQRLRVGRDDPQLTQVALPSAWIDSFHVAPQWRRPGVAVGLLLAGEKWLQDGGAPAVAVYTGATSDAATRVYAVRGYEKVVEVERHGVGKAWVMVKRFSRKDAAPA
jgi:ribosomal protein S18 acetylase RimI-like enzyme